MKFTSELKILVYECMYRGLVSAVTRCVNKLQTRSWYGWTAHRVLYAVVCTVHVLRHRVELFSYKNKNKKY